MAKKLTKDTEFPRAWKDVETGIEFITQPYITSCYMAGTKNGTNVYQGGFNWSNLEKFKKSLRKMEEKEEIADLVMSTLGSFLDEKDFEIINS